jgi:site-specific recombinase XerC
VQTWVVELGAAGQSGASVRKSFGVLSAVLGLAVRDKRLPANPATGVDLPSLKERRRKYLTGAQVEQLAESAGADGWLVVLVRAPT